MTRSSNVHPSLGASGRGMRASWNIRIANLYILLGHVSAFALFLFVSFGHRWLDLDESFLFYPLCWMLFGLAIWSLVTWRIVSGTLFDLYGIFLFAAILFTGGHAILEAVHLNKLGFLSNQFSVVTEFRTLRLVIFCLAALHLGALARCGFASSSRRKFQSQVDTSLESQLTSAMVIVGWTLFLISLLPALMIMWEAVQTVIASGYMGLYAQEKAYGASAGPMILANLLAPSAVLIMIGSRGSKVALALSWTIILCFASLQFFLGYRSSAVMPLLGFAWAFDQRVRRIPRVILLGFGSVLLFVIFPLVRVVRGTAGGNRLSVEYFWESFLGIDNPVVSIIWELGTVMNTVAYTIELVPRYGEYLSGSSYLFALTSVIPNFFWSKHPAVVNSDLASWLVWQVDPGTAARGGGMGYSFVGEAYANFGVSGAALFSLLLGFVLASVVSWAARKPSVLRVAAVGIALCFVPFYARGQALDIVRSLSWYVFVPLLLVMTVSWSAPIWRPGRRNGVIDASNRRPLNIVKRGIG